MREVPIFYPCAANRPTYNKLYHLENTDGKPALSEHCRRIAEYVCSFQPAKGCYAKDFLIRIKACPNASMKTLKRHLAYMIHIKALVQSKDVDPETGEERRILRISAPSAPVVPQKLFRMISGITSYAYLKKEPEMSESNTPKGGQNRPLDPVFFDLNDENLASNGDKRADKMSAETEKMSLFKEEKEETEEEKENQPLKSPAAGPDSWSGEDVWSVGACRPREAGQTAGQPVREGYRPREGSRFVSSSKNSKDDDAWGEPLERSKGPKRKTGTQRRAEAAKLHNAGHVVSPLGRAENRGRRLKPVLCTDIGEVGEPTEPQLYRFLTQKFEENGWSDVLALELPAFKESFSKNLDTLRQKFIDSCATKPTNREIYEYFAWFMEPKRLAKSLNGPSKLPHASWYQIIGLGYVRQFYDQVMYKRHKANSERPTQSREHSQNQAIIDYKREAYEAMRKADEDDSLKVSAMGEYGLVLYAQYLADAHQANASEAKDRIIGILARFVRGFPDKAFARSYIEDTCETTKRNEVINSHCNVWPQWREIIEDFTETTMTLAERAV